MNWLNLMCSRNNVAFQYWNLNVIFENLIVFKVVNWKFLNFTSTRHKTCGFDRLYYVFTIAFIYDFEQISDSKWTKNFFYFFAQNMKFFENEVEYSKNISFVKSLDPNGHLFMNNEVQTCSILTLKILEKSCMR